MQFFQWKSAETDTEHDLNKMWKQISDHTQNEI